MIPKCIQYLWAVWYLGSPILWFFYDIQPALSYLGLHDNVDIFSRYFMALSFTVKFYLSEKDFLIFIYFSLNILKFYQCIVLVKQNMFYHSNIFYHPNMFYPSNVFYHPNMFYMIFVL